MTAKAQSSAPAAFESSASDHADAKLPGLDPRAPGLRASDPRASGSRSAASRALGMGAYVAERMRPLMLLAVGFGLVFVARGMPGLDGFLTLIDLFLATGMMAFFRLWDDLADRDVDRARHPERVLVLASDITVFVRAAIALGMACALGLVLTRGPWVLLQFVAFCAVLWAWYRVGRSRVRATVAYHVLLLKYPAMAVLVAQRPVVPGLERVALGACAMYGAACLYEGWHDPQYGRETPGIWMLGIEACLTATALGYYLKSIPPMGVFV